MYNSCGTVRKTKQKQMNECLVCISNEECAIKGEGFMDDRKHF